jgi:hypothetical protein
MQTADPSVSVVKGREDDDDVMKHGLGPLSAAYLRPQQRANERIVFQLLALTMRDKAPENRPRPQGLVGMTIMPIGRGEGKGKVTPHPNNMLSKIGTVPSFNRASIDRKGVCAGYRVGWVLGLGAGVLAESGTNLRETELMQ